MWGITGDNAGEIDLRIPLEQGHSLAHPVVISTIDNVILHDKAGRRVGRYTVRSADAFRNDNSRFALVLSPELPPEDKQRARSKGGEARLVAMKGTLVAEFRRDLAKTAQIEAFSSGSRLMRLVDPENSAPEPQLNLRSLGMQQAMKSFSQCLTGLQRGQPYKDHFRINSHRRCLKKPRSNAAASSNPIPG